MGTVGEAVCSTQPGPGYCGVTLWPSGAIPYSYDVSVPGPETKAGTMQYDIRQAMNLWESGAGNNVIHFVLSPADPERVIVKNDDDCSSGLPGWDPTAGVQYVDWAPGCSFYHELGHVIGLYHAQQRANRDRYVFVHATAPVCSDYDEWKTCVPTEDDGNNLGEYDLNSTEQYNSAGSPPDMTRRDNGDIISTGMGVPSVRDTASVVELYSRSLSLWKRAVPMGIDVGSTAPLSNALASGVSIFSGSSPAVARSTTTIDVFVRGSDNKTYRRASSALGKPVWGAWTSLGGVATSNPGATSLNGQSVVTVRSTDGNVYIAEQAGGWAWSSVGKPASVSVASDPVLVASGPDQLDVLLRGSDNALWQRRRTGGTWAAWVSRGGALAGTPAVVSPVANTLYIFSNSASGNLVQINSTGTTWTSWFSVPNGSCCLAAGSAPAVAEPNPNRLDVLVRGTDNRLWWKRWDFSTGWASFLPLGGILTSSPVAVALGTARIDAFFIGDNGGLWHRQDRGVRVKGDFDGDGLGDFALYRPSTNTWHIAPRSGAPAYFYTFSGTQQPGLPEDFDNDGRADPVVFGSGTWTIRRSTGDVDMTAAWGDNNDRRLSGDFDGDGLADYVLFRPSNGTWYIDPSRGYGPSFGGRPPWSVAYGTSSDVMVPGDYDGDGKTDIALYRPSQGNWFILRSASNELIVQFGTATDIPIPADYDGDGKVDIAVFRPSNGTWYVHPSTGGPDMVTQFGVATDRLVPKDYDGDGKADVAVFRPSEGKWYVHPTNGGADVVETFGVASDVVF